MPTIKTNNGAVILKGGKPSCTCCAGSDCNACDPDVTILYCSWTPTGGSTSYYVATGSLNYTALGGCWGYFTGDWFDDGDEVIVEFEASWEDGVDSDWTISFTELTGGTVIGSDTRCDPSFSIGDSAGSLVISTSPLI